MKRPYSRDALELKLGLEAGVIEPSEVIAWADRIVEAHDYYDDVANLSLAANASRKEMMSMLSPLIDQAQDQWEAMRRTMGRMHQALLDEPYRAHEFTRFLEHIWICHGYTVPSDMSFMAGIEVQFQLAEQGIYGTVEDATKSLVDALAKFKNYTEPCAPPNGGPATPPSNSEIMEGPPSVS